MRQATNSGLAKTISFFLAILIAVAMIPIHFTYKVSAEKISSFKVKLVDKNTNEVIAGLTDFIVKLTDAQNEGENNSQNSKSGIVDFSNFVNENATYQATFPNCAEMGYRVVGETTFTVTEGQTEFTVVLETNTVTASGVVIDEKGAAAANVSVEFSVVGSGNKNTVQSGQDGSFAVTLVSGKDYVVVAKGDGKYADVSVTIPNVGTQDFSISNPLQRILKSFPVNVDKDFDGDPETDGAKECSIQSESASVAYGDGTTVSVKAGEGYYIKSLTDNGASVQLSEDENEIVRTFQKTLKNVTEAHTLEAIFAPIVYSVEFVISENGTVTFKNGIKDSEECEIPPGNILIDKIIDSDLEENKFSVNATPKNGYRVAEVKVDDKQALKFTENSKAYSDDFTYTKKKHTFKIVFKPNVYKVTVAANENSEAYFLIKGEKKTEAEVEYKRNANIYIRADNYWSVNDVVAGGNSVLKDAEFGENENGIYFTYTYMITDNTNLNVSLKAADQVEKPDNQMDTADYMLEFVRNGEKISVQPESDGKTFVLPYDAKAVFVPKNETSMIKTVSNEEQVMQGFGTKAEISETSNVKQVVVTSNKLQTVYYKTDFHFVIDKSAPEIKDIKVNGDADEKWYNSEHVTISGTVTDEKENEESSGLKAVVWSREKLVDKDDVIKCLTDDTLKSHIAALNKNGEYSFDSEKGEQNTVYYVYAVDNSLNVSEAKLVKVMIDLTQPDITELEASNLRSATAHGTYSNETIKITLSSEDTGTCQSGVKEVHILAVGNDNVQLDLTANQKGEFELSEADFKDGKVISFSVTDNAGNTKAVKLADLTDVQKNIQSDYVKVNNTPVSVTINRPEENKYVEKEDEEEKWWYMDSSSFIVKVEAGGVPLRDVVITLNGQQITAEKFDKAVYSKEYTIDKDSGNFDENGENKLEVKAKDFNNKSVKKESSLWLDNTAPKVTGFTITRMGASPLERIVNFLSFGNFCNDEVEIQIDATDSGSGVKTYKLYTKDEEFEQDGSNTFIIPTETITKEADGKVYFDSILKAAVSDNVGNDSEWVDCVSVNSNLQSSELMIETVLPQVTIAVPDSDPNVNPNTFNTEGQKWYKSDQDLTISVADTDSGIYSVRIYDQNKGEDPVWLYDDYSKKSSKTTEEQSFVINTKELAQAADGSYRLKVSAVDNAGNEASSEVVIYKDTTAPSVVNFEFEAKGYSDGNNLPVEKTNYGYFFREDTTVKVYASDSGPASGVKSIFYYLREMNAEGEVPSSAIKRISVDKNGMIEFTVPANYKGQIFAKADDNVGNVYETFVHPDNLVVEDPEHHASAEEHITFDRPEAQFKTSDGTDLYEGSVPVTITVFDSFAGIRRVDWSIVSPHDKGNDKTGRYVEVDYNGNIQSDGDDVKWEPKSNQQNLITKMTGALTVVNNSNNIVVSVTLTDRAGNQTTQEITFSIDTTKPHIDVVFTPDSNPDNTPYTTYFNQTVTATVTVKERNFDPARITSTLTRDGSSFTELNWNQGVVDNNQPDNNTHVAQIVYSTDGDYEFAMDGKDRADNPLDSPVAGRKLTIDKTNPVITSIDYLNTSVQNGMYYKDAQTVQVTVYEHNFDSARVNVAGTAEDASFPLIHWDNSNSDTHIGTLEFGSSGKYAFTVTLKDMAGNDSGVSERHEFVVDLDDPILEITGVKRESAYNGEVAPIIVAKDVNFDYGKIDGKDAFDVALEGLFSGESKASAVKYDQSVEEIEDGKQHGREIRYKDFQRKKEVDGLYTLNVSVTDLSGRNTRVSIPFSVNRFGSSYDTRKLEQINGMYLQEEQDIVFTETNVDPLVMGETVIKVIANGSPRVLSEGNGYSVEKKEPTKNNEGKRDSWCRYTYKIGKENFADDGRYIVTVFSKDSAGNRNDSTDETKHTNISFFIDKTAPQVIPIDIEEGHQYAEEVKKVTAEISDNLIVSDVVITVDGEKVNFKQDKTTYTFDIPQSSDKRNIVIKAYDAARNESKQPEIRDVLVSTNLIVRWYHNTPLFIGTIVGVVLIGLGVTAFLVFRKKKK